MRQSPLDVPACYDTLDAHLSQAQDIAKASVPMGMLMAWAVQMKLLSTAVHSEHENLILRIAYREAHGSELLIACGGDLRTDLFNEVGREFLNRYYSGYMADFSAEFGAEVYDVRDDWDSYTRIAPTITRSYMRSHKSGVNSAEFMRRVGDKLRGLLGRSR